MKHVLALVAVVAPTSAQTYIVDAWGGPGYHFKDLAVAIAAVPDGATLIVRAGSYPTAIQFRDKSLTIVGQQSPAITGTVRIASLRATDRVTMSGLRVIVPAGGSPVFSASNAAGRLVLDQLQLTATGVSGATAFGFDKCANLHITSSSVVGWTSIAGSKAQISNSSFRGHDGENISARVRPTTALSLLTGRYQMSGCSSQGGSGPPIVSCFRSPIPGYDGADGMHVSGAELVFLNSTTNGGAGSPKGLLCTKANAPGRGMRLIGARLFSSGPYPDVYGDSSSVVNRFTVNAPRLGAVGRFARGRRVQMSMTANPKAIGVLLLGLDANHISLEPIGVGNVFAIPGLIVGPLAFPASGTIRVPLDVPNNWVLHTPLFAQLLTLEPNPAPVFWGSNVAVLIATL